MRPVVDRVLPLDEVADGAPACSRRATHVGKIVLTLLNAPSSALPA